MIALRLLSEFLSLEIIFNSVHGYVLYLQLGLDRQQDLEQDQNYLKVDDIRCIYQADDDTAFRIQISIKCRANAIG